MELFQTGVLVGADYLGTSMMRSLLPQLAAKGSAKHLGSLESAYGAGQIVGSSCLPYLSDLWGRRSILQLSCFGTAVGYGLSAAVAGQAPAAAGWLLASRAAVGLVKQTLTMARAIVGDVQVHERRQAAMAGLTVASCFGYLAGPLAGGWLADALGVAAPMWLVTALFLVLGGLCSWLPETAPSRRSGKASGVAGARWGRGSEWAWTCERQFWHALLAISATEMALTGWTAVARPRITKRILPGGFSSTASFDTWLTFAVMLGCEPWRRWQSGNTSHFMIVGNAAFVVGLAMLWGATSRWVLYLSAVPLGVGISAARTLPAAFLMGCAPEHRRGAVMGVLDLCSSVCRVLAPMLTGFVIDLFDGDEPGLALLILCLLLACGLLLLASEPAPYAAGKPE